MRSLPFAFHSWTTSPPLSVSVYDPLHASCLWAYLIVNCLSADHFNLTSSLDWNRALLQTPFWSHARSRQLSTGISGPCENFHCAHTFMKDTVESFCTAGFAAVIFSYRHTHVMHTTCSCVQSITKEETSALLDSRSVSTDCMVHSSHKGTHKIRLNTSSYGCACVCVCVCVCDSHWLACFCLVSPSRRHCPDAFLRHL